MSRLTNQTEESTNEGNQIMIIMSSTIKPETKFKPFIKEIKVPKNLIVKADNVLSENKSPQGLQIVRSFDEDKVVFLFRAESEHAESFAKDLILKIYRVIGTFIVRQVKTTEMTVDLLTFNKVDLKRFFEASSLGEKFGNYNPTFVLKGWYDSDDRFYPMQNCQIQHLPDNAVKATFVLLTENDSEGAVAQNIIAKCWLALL